MYQVERIEQKKREEEECRLLLAEGEEVPRDGR